MPKRKRLSREDISRLINSGVRVTTPHVTVLFAKNEGNPRVSCSVSKKIETKATRRNAIRRRMAAAFRRAMPDDFSPQAFVIVRSKETDSISFEDLVMDAREAIQKALHLLTKAQPRRMGQ